MCESQVIHMIQQLSRRTLRKQRRAVVDGTNGRLSNARFLTFKQALELGGNVRKGEHGTKVYFVKQLQVADRNGEEGKTRIVPMMREYTVFNVDQCEGLPDRVLTLGEVEVRNTDHTSVNRPSGDRLLGPKKPRDLIVTKLPPNTDGPTASALALSVPSRKSLDMNPKIPPLVILET